MNYMEIFKDIVHESVMQIDEDFSRIIDEVKHLFIKIAKVVRTLYSDLLDSILKCYDDKRIVHLAFFSKKKRVRKKNRKRLIKQLLKYLKNGGQK